MARAGTIEEYTTTAPETTRPGLTRASSAGSAKGSLTDYTMCPNWIYDTLLIEENPSVVKVVLYFNRNTTGRTDAGGQRIEFKQATYGLIASRMNMSVRAVGDAMRTAIAKGYLVQRKVEQANREKMSFEGDFYALNWNWPLRIMSSNNDLSTETEVKSSLVHSLNSQSINTFPLNKISIEDSLPKVAIDIRQNLPGGDRQNLPTCINKAKNTQTNKKIELELVTQEFEKPQSYALTTTVNSTISQEKPVKAKFSIASSQTNKVKEDQIEPLNRQSQAKSPGKRRGSSSVGQLITDLTRAFGDKPALVLPNITRALNLWHKTELSEKEFLDRIYQARKKTLSCGLILNRRQSLSGELPADLPNRMPYFFSVLGEMLETVEPLPQAVITPRQPVRDTGPDYSRVVSSVITSKEIVLTASPGCEDDSAIIWQKVREALQERFRNSQLAEKVASVELAFNEQEKQLILSSPGCPWLLKSLLSSELALLQLALTQQIGEGYKLSLH